MPVRSSKLRTGTHPKTPPRSGSFNKHPGALLTLDDSKSSYVLVRHNVRTYVSAGVVAVIQGRQNAEAAMREYQNRQAPADAHEGWRYFLEKTGLRPGMDPSQATEARQRELELRESKESAVNGGLSSLGQR